MAVWDRCGYIIEAEKQLCGKDILEEVPYGPELIIGTVHKTVGKIGKTFNISQLRILHLLSYLLPIIHKLLHDVHERLVISNSSYYLANISQIPILPFTVLPFTAQVAHSYVKVADNILQ